MIISDVYKEQIEQDKKQIQERKQAFEKNYPIYKRKIEQALEQERYKDLIKLFQREEVIRIAQLDNMMGILHVAVSIYQMELQEKVPHTILDSLHTIKEVETVYLRTKFLMWKLEFADETETFMDHVMERQISVPYIKYLIHTSAFYKADTSEKIALSFKERKSYGNAFGMLNYLNELGGSEEYVYCEMADICMLLQQYQQAADCIARIQKPTGLLAEYERKWGI